MSGEGLISVRFPRSLLGVFRAGISRVGVDLHTGARYLISGLQNLTPDELIAIPEPAQELDNPRVSLYVGWALMDILAEFCQKTHLSTSSIMRRLIYGLFIQRSIRFVQHSGNKEWRLVSVQNNDENTAFKRIGEKNRAAS